MAYIPNTEEILSKDNIRWITNGEPGDESILNRPIDDVANFAETLKYNAIFSDPSKKGLTEQTINNPLKINSYLELSVGDTKGLKFTDNISDNTDKASITLDVTDGTQILRIKSLNDEADEIHLETLSKDGVKMAINVDGSVTLNTMWHSGNDGINSGLDADLVRGKEISTDNTINTIVLRDNLGNFSANKITANKFEGNASNVTDVVAAINGGTGISSYTKGDLLIADSTTSISKSSPGIEKTFLVSNGVGNIPEWRKLKHTDFDTDFVTAPSNGGTGLKGTITGIMYANGTNPVSIASAASIVSAIGDTKINKAKFADEAGSLTSSKTYVGLSFNGMTGFSSTDTDILMNGTQDAGISTSVARADHIHPSDTSKANLSGSTFTGAVKFNHAGTNTSVSLTLDSADETTGIYKNAPKEFTICAETVNCVTFRKTGSIFSNNVQLPLNTTIGSVSSTEISYLSGLKGNIQNQLDRFDWNGSRLLIRVNDTEWKQVYPAVYA